MSEVFETTAEHGNKGGGNGQHVLRPVSSKRRDGRFPVFTMCCYVQYDRTYIFAAGFVGILGGRRPINVICFV